MTCIVDGCTRKAYAKGTCAPHRYRFLRAGDYDLIEKRRWAPHEDKVLIEALATVPPDRVRVPRGTLERVAKRLGRRLAGVNKRAHVIRHRAAPKSAAR